MMAVQTFHVDELNIKKEIDEEEESVPTDPVIDPNVKPVKTIKQEGDQSLRENLKCEDESEDESEDEKPDINLLNKIIGSNCKLEDESDSDSKDDKSLIFPKPIKTEPLSPVKERTVTDIKININNDSSDDESIPITKEVKKDVDLSLFQVEEGCGIIKNYDDFGRNYNCVAEMPLERSQVNDLSERHSDSSRRKRKFSSDSSDDIDANPVEEFNIDSPAVKTKRVRFAEDCSIKSTRIYERTKKPITFVPSKKEPGVGILKNKLLETDHHNSSVNNITKQKKKVKTVRNRKEGKRTKSMPDADVINKKLLREKSKAKESSSTKRKEKKALNKNTQTNAKSRITYFFDKKNKDPNKTQLDSREETDKNETSESNQMESLEAFNGENQKTNKSNETKNNESQKENMVVDYTTRNIYINRQKRKSKEQYAFKCPVLAYLCICGVWCKSGPELNAHLSVCAKLQPRVVLTRLKL